MNAFDINGLLSQMRAAAAIAQGPNRLPPTPPVQDGVPTDFSSLLRQSIDTVNGLQMDAGKLANDFEKGVAGVDLPDVMIASQKANISFQAMAQIRNKCVSAYQDIMSMQV